MIHLIAKILILFFIVYLLTYVLAVFNCRLAHYEAKRTLIGYLREGLSEMKSQGDSLKWNPSKMFWEELYTCYQRMKPSHRADLKRREGVR